MKRNETPLISERSLQEALDLGHKLMRLRRARKMRQEDAAIRADVSRSTAVLIEKGDIGRTLAQVLRYTNCRGVVSLTNFYVHVPRHMAESRELQPGELVEDAVVEFRPEPEQYLHAACL